MFCKLFMISFQILNTSAFFLVVLFLLSILRKILGPILFKEAYTNCNLTVEIITRQ